MPFQHQKPRENSKCNFTSNLHTNALFSILKMFLVAILTPKVAAIFKTARGTAKSHFDFLLCITINAHACTSCMLGKLHTNRGKEKVFILDAV